MPGIDPPSAARYSPGGKKAGSVAAGRGRVPQGFSLIEIVLGLTIMSILVGVTVTTYQDSAARAREQVARDESKAVASAIQRWQLENQRAYPFQSVLPLIPRYVKNVGNDPWSKGYRVDTKQKIVYSFGPNGADDVGAGDDIPYFYDTTGDVAPGPPGGLTARLKNTDVKLHWVAPKRNADGSQPVDDLDFYRVYIRSSTETTVRTFGPDVPATGSVMDTLVSTSQIATIYGAGPPDPFEKSYYFTVRAHDNAGNISVPSNQAGLFVAKEVRPTIVDFRPSSTSPAVSSAFSFYIEVSDADSNLSEVRIRNFGPDVVFTTAAAQPFKIGNQFKFVKTWAPSPTDPAMGAGQVHNGVFLEAKDESGNDADASASWNITVVNDPPVITSLNPGIKLLTVNPAVVTPVKINFTMEANDQESNMDAMHVELWKVGPGPPAPVPGGALDYTLNPPGPAMVRTTSYTFAVSAIAEYELRVTASDTELDTSLTRVSKIIIKEDTTPPDAMAFSLDPSNLQLTTQPIQGIWFVNDPSQLKMKVEAFEIESPPITYQFKITTAPFGPSWETGPVYTVGGGYAGGASAAYDWWDVHDPPGLDVTLGQGAVYPGGGLAGPFDEKLTYRIGMRALNSAGLTNISTVEPEGLQTLVKQNPFRLDATPPTIASPVEILGKNSGGQIWVNDVLSAEWDVTDYVEGNPAFGLGSGANLYQYRIRRFDPGPVNPDPLVNWTTVKTKQLQAITLPTANVAVDNGVDVVIEVMARDLAGNWTLVPETGSAKVDFTPPTSPGIPTIVNQVNNIISVIDTFSADWLGAFVDYESGIESYEWGIATTANLPPGALPDVYGWLPSPGSAFTSGTISQNNLLTEGDSVHAVVRARNYAGGTSISVPSTAAIVNVNLFTSLQGVPSTGLSPLSVNFTATVTGGAPPYDYTFQFDGTSLKQWKFTGTSQTKVETTFVYNLADASLPRPEIIARLIIEDFEGRTSQKDFIIDIRDDIMGAMAVSRGGNYGVHFFRLDGTSVTPLWTLDDNSKYFGQVFVEPRGAFMVGVQRHPTETAGIDVFQFSRLDRINASVAPGFNQDGINFHQGATQSSMVFSRNQPQGMFTQVHNAETLASPGGLCSQPGWMRALPYGLNGKTANPGFATRFGCDTESLFDPVPFYGAVANPDNFSQGVVVYKSIGTQPGPAAGVWMKSISGLGFSPVINTSYGSAATPLTTFIATAAAMGPLPTFSPQFSVDVQASRAGYWMVSNNLSGPANAGVYRVPRQGSGLGLPAKIAPASGGMHPGNLDFTEDGQFMVVLLSGDGAGNTWDVGTAFVDEPTYRVAGQGNTDQAINLDMDDGGTRIAVASNNAGIGRLTILPVDFATDPPQVQAATSPTPINLATYFASNSKYSGSPLIRDVALFRRPANGLPVVHGVYSGNDDSVLGDGNPLNGNPAAQDTDTFLMVKGVNLDKVPNGSISIIAKPPAVPFTSGDCTGLSPDRTLLPPLNPFGSESGPAYSPANGDTYHFMRVNLPGFCATWAPTVGTQFVELEVSYLLGANPYTTTTEFAMVGP